MSEITDHTGKQAMQSIRGQPERLGSMAGRKAINIEMKQDYNNKYNSNKVTGPVNHAGLMYLIECYSTEDSKLHPKSSEEKRLNHHQDLFWRLKELKRKNWREPKNLGDACKKLTNSGDCHDVSSCQQRVSSCQKRVSSCP